MSRSGRVRSSQPLLQMAVALVVAWVGACADEGVGSGSDSDRVLGAAVALPAGPVPECEVLVQHHAVGLSWRWRWGWDAGTRTLRTHDGSWTLRYDEQGRLVEDIRTTDGFRAQYAYAALQGALSGRLVYRHENLDQTTSFAQQVARMSNINYAELDGVLHNGQPRSERIEYNEAGLVRRFDENGFSSVVRYRPDNHFDRAFRPNRSEVSCTYDAAGDIKDCMEDGVFDPTRPQWGAARDGVPDVEWRFLPGCRPIQALASPAWFSLPNVAALPACLRNVPPWRSPAAGCSAYNVSWVTRGPGRVSGQRNSAEQSEPIECTDSPCLASTGNGFSLRTRGGHAAGFVCQEDRTGKVKEGSYTALELGPIANNWNCIVTFEQPSSFEIAWTTDRPDRVSGLLWRWPLEPCWQSPCHVARGSRFSLGTPGEPAGVECLERQLGDELRSDIGLVEIASVRDDWDCTITFDGPTPTHTVSWSSDLPSRVRGFQRVFDHLGVEGTPPWTLCETASCEVTTGGNVFVNVIGKRTPHVYCEDQKAEPEPPIERKDRYEFEIPKVTSDWKCSVTFGQLPRHAVTWKVRGPGNAKSWVRDLGLSNWQECTPDSCLIRDEDEFALSASPGARYECRWEDDAPDFKRREGHGPYFILGPVERNWHCDVRFDTQPVPPSSPSLPQPMTPLPTSPSPTPKQYTVTWDGASTSGTASGGACSSTSCTVSESGSVTLSVPEDPLVYFTCREKLDLQNLDPRTLLPALFRFVSLESPPFTLSNIRKSWHCEIGVRVI